LPSTPVYIHNTFVFVPSGDSNFSALIIREHLAALLDSPQFVRSHRLRRFLEFVVECKITGRDDEIQEYTIGLEVFDRGESFDPRSDSIVRVEARRLRNRLADYYAKEGKRAPIRIVLPERGYTPLFEPRSNSRSTVWAISAGLAAVVFGLLFYSFHSAPLAPSRHEPSQLARESFEKGLVAWQQWTADGARQAERLFQQAVAHDPVYALGYAWLSAAYRQRAMMGDADPHEVFAKSSEAAQKAIALDPQLAEGYKSLAVNLTFKPDWTAAERAFRTAIQLEPDDPNIHHTFGIVLLAASVERLAEGEAELRRAVRLKPGDLGTRVVLGKILYFRGRFQEARSILEETLRIDAHYPDAMRNLASVLVQMGDYDEAVRLLEEAQRLAYLRWGDGLLGHALAVSNNEERARTILADLKSRYAANPVGALAIATIYVGLQEGALACDWLEKAWANREMRTRYIGVDPIYAHMREQPCFVNLVENTGLSNLATPSY
jgi:Tfp pilus assembly protein PilF